VVGALSCDALAENPVNALYEPAKRYNQGHVSTHGVRTRLDQADVLACAVGLDMVQSGWKPRSIMISVALPNRGSWSLCARRKASPRLSSSTI
jgi:ParB family chromosome partitioning protein